jgi:hypothetical protein
MSCSSSSQAVLFSVPGSPAPITEVKELRPIRAKVEAAVKYWYSVILVDASTDLPSADGGLFFTAEEGYTLDKLNDSQ